MITARVQTPAKINLGLEIPGKRPDGYHEIVTVLCMIDLADTLTVFPDSSRSGTTIQGVSTDQNLVTRALAAFNRQVESSPAFGWSLEKRIPAAAGLGGASSNAAGALLAANALLSHPLSRGELAMIANTLGSDIAFFLGEPMALGTGTGTTLSPLSPIPADVLLIVPLQTIENKTASMYGALRSGDFSSGSKVMEGISALRAGAAFERGHMRNAFSRPLLELVPVARQISEVLTSSEGLPWGLSGAGPAFFVLSPAQHHDGLIARLRTHCSSEMDFFSTKTRQEPLTVHLMERADQQ